MNNISIIYGNKSYIYRTSLVGSDEESDVFKCPLWTALASGAKVLVMKDAGIRVQIAAVNLHLLDLYFLPASPSMSSIESDM